MSSSTVYPMGSAEVTVAASDKVAVYSRGVAQIYQKVSYPNYPDSWSLLGSTNNSVVVTSAFSAAGTVRIDAGAAPVLYAVGTAANITEMRDFGYQGDPTAMTTAATITVAGILSGIITGTHSAGATAAYTLPTGTLLDAASDMAVGDSFNWSLLNLSAAAVDTITLTAGTDHTIVGNPIVQSAHSTTGGIYGNSAMWRTRKTAANTFVTYRIA